MCSIYDNMLSTIPKDNEGSDCVICTGCPQDIDSYSVQTPCDQLPVPVTASAKALRASPIACEHLNALKFSRQYSLLSPAVQTPLRISLPRFSIRSMFRGLKKDSTASTNSVATPRSWSWLLCCRTDAADLDNSSSLFEERSSMEEVVGEASAVAKAPRRRYVDGRMLLYDQGSRLIDRWFCARMSTMNAEVDR